MIIAVGSRVRSRLARPRRSHTSGPGVLRSVGDWQSAERGDWRASRLSVASILLSAQQLPHRCQLELRHGLADGLTARVQRHRPVIAAQRPQRRRIEHADLAERLH